MTTPQSIEPRPARRYLTGLGFLGGMLTLTFIQSAAKLNWVACAASLFGILVAALLHRLLERDIPHVVDAISTQVSQMPEGQRRGLRDYLKGGE